MPTYTIIDRRPFPSITTPGRLDTLVIYAIPGAGTVAVRIEKENPTSADVDAAIRAAETTRQKDINRPVTFP